MKVELPTRTDIHQAFLQGESEIISIIEKQNQVIELLVQEVQTLKDQVAKNSQNSSQPPSSDGYQAIPRTQSLRQSTGQRIGGVVGHKGNTLKQVKKPDKVELYQLHQCRHCQSSLDDVGVVGIEKRQVFDLPPLHILVTEHQGEKKICPRCRYLCTADFPPSVTQPTQYGSLVKAFAVYFSTYQLVPLERTSEIFTDLFSCSLNESTILSYIKDAKHKIYPVVKQIQKYLTYQSAVDHFDETGIRVQGRLYWLHAASNELLTLYYLHKRQGSIATGAMGILPHFHGIAIHDYRDNYFSYLNCQHGLCNAHHLRELTFIYEQYHQKWANNMAKLLIKIKETVTRAKKQDEKRLTAESLSFFSHQYDRLIEAGFRANPLTPKEHRAPEEQSKRVKHTPAQNLLFRLKLQKRATLIFMYDFRVPFDNNLVERDIRMVKLKQKISGCFRTTYYASIFCVMRSYLSTVRKHSHAIVQALESVFASNPYIPETLLNTS